MIPSVEECFKFMEKYEMFDNIKAHSVIVEKVASVIAKGLRESGMDISLEKVVAGSLMHDIGKALCLNSDEDHAAKGKEICIQNHLEEIAEIVGQHIRLKNDHLNNGIHEEELVYYADKRVNHDKVVSLDERLEYLLTRYGKKGERLCQLIRKNFEICKKVEERLFAKLNFSPNDLAEMIKSINHRPA